jgi:hypothetical protein
VSGGPVLAVFVDGAPLGDDEARSLWGRFSAHMEAHKGDLAGFARCEGFVSVHPEVRDGRPALVASKTGAAPQRAYANAPVVRSAGGGSPTNAGGGTGGSGAHRSGSGSSHRPRGTSQKGPVRGGGI